MKYYVIRLIQNIYSKCKFVFQFLNQWQHLVVINNVWVFHENICIPKNIYDDATTLTLYLSLTVMGVTYILLYVFFFMIIHDYSDYDNSSDLENPLVVKLGISQIKWFDIAFGIFLLLTTVNNCKYLSTQNCFKQTVMYSWWICHVSPCNETEKHVSWWSQKRRRILGMPHIYLAQKFVLLYNLWYYCNTSHARKWLHILTFWYVIQWFYINMEYGMSTANYSCSRLLSNVTVGTRMSQYIKDGGGGLTLMNNWVIDMQVIMQVSP